MGNTLNPLSILGGDSSFKPTKEQIEVALLVRLFKFDLNKGIDPELSLENRVQREHCNDLGEYPMNHTIHILMTEFKKFIFLNSIEIQKRIREGTLNKEENYQRNGKWYFKAPFSAPPYIDKMWKALILYNYIYEDFCEGAAGGFIDRTPPQQDYEQAFKDYQECLKHLDERDTMLKPLHSVWPRYKSAEDYKRDFECFSFIPNADINKIKQEMIGKFKESGLNKLDLNFCEELAKEIQEEYLTKTDYEKPDLKPVKGFDHNVENFNVREMDAVQAYEKIQSMPMPD